MDPVGPWSAYASYNRLAGVQAGAASGDFHHHLAGSGSGLGGHNPPGGVPSTTSQLLLQAAHTTASLAGQLGSSTAPFNPSGFLSPPPVAYDAVFSPLFHHTTPKPAHYSSTINAQHRQALVQAQAAAASKQASESELSTLRDNYTSHHQSLAAAQGSTFFDQSTAPGSASGLAWQGNNQLPSPFGILPHESVVPSSPSPAATKSSSSAAYENFNVHFAAAQINNHISSQLVANANKAVRSASPQVTQPVKPVPSQASASVTAGTFFQTSATFGNPSENISSYSTSNAKSGPISTQQEYGTSGSKSFSSTGTSSSSHVNQQSCIVSVSSSATSPDKTFRSSVTPSRTSNNFISRSEKSRSSNFVPPKNSNSQVQTKAQSKIYSDINHIEHRRNSNSSPQDAIQPQSSPISYSIVDTSRVTYSNSNSNKSAPTRTGSQYSINQPNVTYRHYQNVDTDYHSRTKSSTSDGTYSGGNTKSGTDCSVVVPRRPSPLQVQSQASPLGHVPSPAYPMYNSPMNSISSPQQSSEPSQNPVSYKSGNHVAPRSPLDVSISRPTSLNSQVAYPSVITRALNVEQSNKSFENRYDHSHPPSQSQQSCWDDERQQNQNNRKFVSSSTSSYSNSNVIIDNTNRSNDNSAQTVVQQPSQRSLPIDVSEKQSFFDNRQTSSHDLTSCRGDPMSIVKNLQTLQQSCQVQQEQSKHPIKENTSPSSTISSVTSKSSIRRKSNEKQVNHSISNDLVTVSIPEYLSNRIPPPAHSSTNNQQQNGTYYDLERWNLPPPSKMFPGSSTAYTAQSSLHAGNFVPTQHHSLMVSHSHSHAALPYFPLHLPTHPPEFQPSLELTPLAAFNNSTPVSVSSSTSEIRDGEQPKVVVPNIEEELGFLAEQRANSTAPTPPAASHQSPASSISSPQEIAPKVPDKKLTVPAVSAGSSFMASYLKFLQGERDTSPPPATRGGRKATWSRSNNANNKTYNDQINSKVLDHQNLQTPQNSNGTITNSGASNTNVPMNTASVLSPVGNMNSTGNIVNPGSLNTVGVMSPGNMMPSMPSVAKTIESSDDSRYFSVPKDRKRKFDGLDDGFDTNDDEARRINKPVLNVPSTPLSEKGKKGRTNINKTPAVVTSPQGSNGPKKPRPAVQPSLPVMQAQSHQQYYYQQPDEADPLMLPQRRESTYRKAKEKSNVTQLLSRGVSEVDDADDVLQDFIDSDSDPAWSPLTKDDGDSGISVNSGLKQKSKQSRGVAAATGVRKTSLSNILSVAAHGAGIDYADYSSEDENSAAKKLNLQRTLHQTSIIQQTVNARCEEMPYQSGEFVAVKSELSELWPAIWRVDGKALLQKFEPFDQNGKILYRNISTYAAWNPDSKKLYIQVPVRVRAQNHLDIVVELMKNEFSVDDNVFIEKRMQDTATYQDNFEVYIQTLISHALDPNFLTEIFQEQDEYFLSNVKTVDDITEERRRQVIGAGVLWSRSLEAAINTWPCLNNTELAITAVAACSICRLSRATQRIQVYGQPYNPSTLEPRQPDLRVAYEKESVMCRPCANRIELFSRISHQKYLMFIECNKRVSEKRSLDPHKDTTLILNELLADESWLSQLFRDVRQSWADAESVERKFRQLTTRQLI